MKTFPPQWLIGTVCAGRVRRWIAAMLVILVATPTWVQSQDSLLDRVLRRGLPAAPPAEPSPEPTSAALERFQDGGLAADAGEEVLPGPGERVRVPLSRIGAPGEVRFEDHGERISLVVRDASLSYVLTLLAERRGLNVVAPNSIDASITITLFNQTLESALTAILSAHNYTWTYREGIIYVTSLSNAAALPAELQGRQIQVFPLDYASAPVLSEAVASFLSPVGQVFISQSDPADNRRTQEVLVVEDLPQWLERVAAFVDRMDQPPLQVSIEAHILQVDLKDDRASGVNFEHLFNVMGNNVAIRSVPNPIQLPGSQVLAAGTNPAFFATVSGGNLTALVELMKTTTDAKTLASPRLLVINEQHARLQVGEQLGYRVTQTTETSTLESVNFLDVGVILDITPRITRDNRVMLKVRPEVSGGQVNSETGLPDSETSYLETNVLLDDGFGVVIGGLIKETDSVVQSKVPYLGDLHLVGRLFQRQEVIKERSEIIVVLIPRVYPYNCDYADYERGNVVRAETDLLEGPLLRKDRPWLPKLPDAVTNPRQLHVPPIGKAYPYPALPVERAGTPQPQREFPVPTRPGPAVQWQPYPVEMPYQESVPHAAPSPYKTNESSMPIVFGHDPHAPPAGSGPPPPGAR